jgi:hypothetical protein
MSSWQEHWLEDIEFYFRIKDVNECVVDFEVYELYHYDDGNGNPLKMQYFQENKEYYTHNPDLCEPYVKGFIKWDGCSEVNFAKNIHSCGGRESLVRLGPLFDKIFDCAKQMITSSENYL